MNVEQYVARVPEMYRNAFQKALDGKSKSATGYQAKMLGLLLFSEERS